jgi:hypothetical protein
MSDYIEEAFGRLTDKESGSDASTSQPIPKKRKTIPKKGKMK